MSVEAMKQAMEALEGIHPGNMTPMAEESWNKAIASLRQAIEQAEKQAVFKIYKPTLPRGAIPNVRDAELPWVYDQDPSSGNVASMWVTPVKAAPQPQQAEKQEPVPWQGCDLDGMVEAFDRVIEAHFFRKNPFHNPIDADAQMALRILRGFIPYMKQYTTPQSQREWVEVECPLCGEMAVAHTHPVFNKREWVGLTYEDMVEIWGKLYKTGSDVLPTTFGMAIQAKLKEKNHVS